MRKHFTRYITPKNVEDPGCTDCGNEVFAKCEICACYVCEGCMEDLKGGHCCNGDIFSDIERSDDETSDDETSE